MIYHELYSKYLIDQIMPIPLLALVHLRQCCLYVIKFAIPYQLSKYSKVLVWCKLEVLWEKSVCGKNSQMTYIYECVLTINIFSIKQAQLWSTSDI